MITATLSLNGETVIDKTRLTIVNFDMDVDSDNTKGAQDPDGDAIEDYIEQEDGYDQKIIPTNDDDSDGDGIAGVNDGWNADGVSGTPDSDRDSASNQDVFTPVMFTISPAIDWNVATAYIYYQDYNPNDPPLPPEISTGRVRLWTKPGGSTRNPLVAPYGNYVLPGDSYRFADLDEGNSIRLYAEGIIPSREKGDVMISAYVDPDGDEGPQGYMLMDSVQLTVVNVDVLIGADQAFNDSTGDDWVSPATPSNTQSITNYVRLIGPINLQVDLTLEVANRGTGTIDLIPVAAQTTAMTGGKLGASLDTNASFGPAYYGYDFSMFRLTGGTTSSATEDVMVLASLAGGTLGQQSLTVLPLTFFAETGGESAIPLNPAIVTNAAAAIGGNVFGISAGNFVNDKSGISTLNTTKSYKISPDKIDVIWGRMDNTGEFTTSISDTTFEVAPAVSDLTDGTVTKLRMRDRKQFTIPSGGGSQTVTYFVGHPSSRNATSPSLQNNYSARIDAEVRNLKTYPIFFHFLQGPTMTLSLTAVDVAAIMSDLDKIYSQAGISFSIVGNATETKRKNGTSLTDWDMTPYVSGASAVFGDQSWLTDINQKSGAIDVYFVDKVYADYDRTFETGAQTVIPNPTGADLAAASPGVIIGANSGNYNNLSWEDKKALMTRTIGHELLHYLTNWTDADHSNDNWNLFRGGERSTKRDITIVQVERIDSAGPSTTSPDF